MIWAHINASGIVTELTTIDPTGRFYPGVEWIECTTAVSVGWSYDGSAFHAASALVIDWPALARIALAVSDVTILRCYENAVVVPTAWSAYRAALRSIVAGEVVTALPVRPDYPAGT